uniref:hypothetical protein n=1 Tax=Polaromonas sp. TaxID=1869339 RepID=UPI0015978667|nr:hypothetical protein [Polaromonas sp.]QJS06442.1 hypothetical protein [Polaromonas sp.]
MESLSNLQLIFIWPVLFLGIFTVIGFLGSKLADQRPGDVRVVWYLFSLAFVCTCIAALWASSIGALDGAGVFQGRWGDLVNKLLLFMLDLETDIKVFLVILAVFVLPQITSYLLSGLFGCAAAPIFVGRAVNFFVWSVVKSIAVASGIVFTVALYGWVSGWTSWSLKGAASMLWSSFMLLAVAFGFLYAYRDIDGLATMPSEKDLPVKNRLSRLRAWFTRRSS